MRIRHAMWVASALGLTLSLAMPAEAAKAKSKRAVAVAHAAKQRHLAARPFFQNGVLAGPLYNGQDYLGDDPDPNIRSYMIRDMGRYGGVD